MKKRSLHILFLCLVSFFATAFADQHVSTRVSENVIHHEYYVNQGPWSIHVLEIELKQPNILVETTKAKNRITGLEKLLQIVKQVRADSTYQLVAAVNGDFFSPEGISSGAQVQQGVLLKNPRVGWSVLGLTWQHHPFIDRVWLQAFVKTHDNKTFPINAVNSSRKKDQLVLYNSFRGESTHSNEFGSEVILQPLSRTTP